MVSRFGAAALVLVGLATATLPVHAANAGRAAPAPGAAPAPRAAPPSTEARSDNGAVPTNPPISQDAAARARMHECAHQWASIKKAGTAGATTWKEFSATCLVVGR